MANIICIASFILLNFYFVKYMFSYDGYMKNPMNSRSKLHLEGLELFIILLFATGTMAMAAGAGGRGTGTGFNLQAIRLLLLEVVLVMSVFVSQKKVQWGIGIIAYIIYMLWLLYSMTYSEAGQYGWRYILKYIYPLLIMMGTSAIVRDEEVFVAICVWIRRIAFVAAIIYYIPGIGKLFGPLFWYGTALNIHYVTISCASLALYFFYGKDKKDLIIAALFVLPCLLMTHRTGLMAMFTALTVFCFYKFKWISLPYIVGVAAIGIGIIFYVPSFHQKMFWREAETGQTVTIQDLREGNITEDDIRNNGREAVWEMLEEEFYVGRELKGSGIGSCQKFLYEAGGNVVKQTHGDYIQMRCDTGLIGMYLYIAIAALIVIHSFIECVRPSNPDYIKACAMIVGGSIVGNYFGMYSDNAVTYTMATTGYPFGFYGIMLGLKAKLRGE